MPLVQATIFQISLASIFISTSALAQITPDTTLGNENSRVKNGINVKGNQADLIEGGIQRGSNLYHSFSEFNVNNGQRVYFANPTGIENILSRITGNNSSQIFGTLGVNGAANLFLLNPKGIIFGENAQLDIEGSFLATTADSFQFPDGSEFSATNPQAPPLLTMSVPVGVQFGSQPAQSITNQGNLVTGNDLTLNAGSLDLQGTLQVGGNLTLQAQDSVTNQGDLVIEKDLTVNAGSLDLQGTLQAGGNVTLQAQENISNQGNLITGNDLILNGGNLNLQGTLQAGSGNIVLQAQENLTITDIFTNPVIATAGGNIVLQSDNIINSNGNLSAGGSISIQNLSGGLGSIVSRSSYDSVIRATGDVSFDSYQGASLHILAGGSVNISGDIEIIVNSIGNSLQETVTLSDGTTIDIDGSQTPTLDIRAGVDTNYIGIPTTNFPIGFNPQNPSTTNTPTNANINIQGRIENTSGFEANNGKILITNQYHPNGLAGNITTGVISTFGNVFVDSRGDITTTGDIDTTIVGSATEKITAGSIKLLGNQNILIQGSLLSNVNNLSPFSNNVNEMLEGDGGDIYINSRHGNIDINADIISKSETGNAGDIEIYTNKLFLDNSEINTNSDGGLAGIIKIEAKDQISLNQSKIFSQGNDGQIDITTDNLLLNQKSEINTNSDNSGIAGIITINTKDEIYLDNESQIFSQGNNGIIDITTGNLILNQQSKINTNSNNSENAGDIIIKAKDQIFLNKSQIFSQGNNGIIDIYTNDFSLTNGSQMSTSLKSSGDKVGTISIEAKNSVLLQGNLEFGSDDQTGIYSQIIEDGELLDSGGTGNITINTNKLMIKDGAVLLANSERKGDAGSISIDAEELVFIGNKGRVSSSITSTGQGKSGDVNIKTNFLSVDGGTIEVLNEGEGDAGDIAIKTQNLLLRRQSKIAATAGSTNNPGNGGSISIDAEDGFVVAVPSEDSDIIANAFGGEGGDIKITANSIFGFQNQENLSTEELQQIDNNGISDISASSDIGKDGEISLNTLNLDPTQGLVTLATNLVDTSRLIAQGCGGNSNVAQSKSEFVITGRGGLPPSPDDTLKPGAILPTWVVNNSQSSDNNSSRITETNFQKLSTNDSENNADTLVEAVGMVRNANGEIVFTTQPTTATTTELQSRRSSQVCSFVPGDVK